MQLLGIVHRAQLVSEHPIAIAHVPFIARYPGEQNVQMLLYAQYRQLYMLHEGVYACGEYGTHCM